MFETIGAPELLIIGLVVILLFGVGKIGTMGKELGTSVKEFRRAMREDDDTPAVQPTTASIVETPVQLAAPAAAPVAPSVPETNRGPQVF